MRRTIKIKTTDPDMKIDLTMKIDATPQWSREGTQSNIDRITDAIYKTLLMHFNAKHIHLIQKNKKKNRGKK